MYASQRAALVASLLAIGVGLSPVRGQIPGVDLFQDSQSDSVCDVVNAANAELVVLQDTGEFALVTGEDTRLEGTLVDVVNGDVFINGDPAGFVTFADDGDGLRSLWWLAPSGFAAHIDTITLEVSESDLLPSEFIDVPCDACAFWDVAEDCLPSEPQGPPPSIEFCGSGVISFGLISMLGLVGDRRRRSAVRNLRSHDA